MLHLQTLREAYASMLRIRLAEEAIASDFISNQIFSFYHSSVGQEAVAVGAAMAMSNTDKFWGNHRSHGHYLAKGGSLQKMFAEIYGKEDGCCRGRGGSMHPLDRRAGFMGATPILGSVVSLATGGAFAEKQRRSGVLTTVFLGDGASEEGVVYESWNLAALFALPIVYVIENNLYAVNSAESARRSPYFSCKGIVEGLGLHYLEADGNDFESMFSWMREARSRQRPVVLMARCYRQLAHSGPILDESVRVIDTAGAREEADPIRKLSVQLQRLGVDLQEINQRVGLEVRDAFYAAQDSQLPEPADLERGSYV
jgi:TPP-dependent pyruvate/acetoin dehydrogenase alpha subunit